MKTVVFYNNTEFSEPQSGFRIAFNMFDTDGNQKVDKNEFLVVSTKFPFLIFDQCIIESWRIMDISLQHLPFLCTYEKPPSPFCVVNTNPNFDFYKNAVFFLIFGPSRFGLNELFMQQITNLFGSKKNEELQRVSYMWCKRFQIIFISMIPVCWGSD